MIEACGPHEWMHDVLVEEGAEVFICRPPSREGGREKNDKLDADLIAKDYLAGRLQRVWVPPPPLRLLREVVRQRHFLVQHRVSVTNHVKNELNRWNIRNETIEKDREDIIKRLPHLSDRDFTMTRPASTVSCRA